MDDPRVVLSDGQTRVVSPFVIPRFVRFFEEYPNAVVRLDEDQPPIDWVATLLLQELSQPSQPQGDRVFFRRTPEPTREDYIEFAKAINLWETPT